MAGSAAGANTAGGLFSFPFFSPQISSSTESIYSPSYVHNTSSQYTYSPTSSVNEVLTLNLNSPNSNLSPTGNPIISPVSQQAASLPSSISPDLSGSALGGSSPLKTTTLLILGGVVIIGAWLIGKKK